MLPGMPQNETRRLFQDASVVIGPHGAGLFNAPLFSSRGTVLIAFGLLAEHEAKEDNLIAVCAATGLKLLRLPVFRASFFGDYSLAPPESSSRKQSSASPPRNPGSPPTAAEVAESIVSHMLYGF
jgi:hypothetical protein